MGTTRGKLRKIGHPWRTRKDTSKAHKGTGWPMGELRESDVDVAGGLSKSGDPGGRLGLASEVPGITVTSAVGVALDVRMVEQITAKLAGLHS